MRRRQTSKNWSRRKFLRNAGIAGSVLGGSATLAGCAVFDKPVGKLKISPFMHGVASGDPLPDRVILWTRVTVADGKPWPVQWEISTTANFSRLTASGKAIARIESDHTVKIDATGLLAGRSYYYRFFCGGFTSAVGRTRTATQGHTQRLRFAVLSCASYPHGFFNAYARVAERSDLDCVFHLGDYIYEYGNAPGEYGADVQAGGRIYDPPHPIVSLADYRQRHKQYKADPDLQACHRQHPFICVWDDHELTNDAYRDGAENHKPDQGEWRDRSSAGARAYAEWMPIRLPDANDPERIYRHFRFGDLVDLIMLDTRFIGRDKQLTATLPVPALKTKGFTDDGPFADTNRRLLGEPQLQFLGKTLHNSPARWKLLGQQVMFGQLKTQGASNASNSRNAGGQGGIFLNTDQWDGYPRERERLWKLIRGDSKHHRAIHDVVVLTGDIHSAWSMDITEDPNNPSAYEPTSGKGAMAVEFVATSVSSPGLAETAEQVGRHFISQNPHLKYVNLRDHGYLLLDIDHRRCQGEHWFVADPRQRDARQAFAAGFFTLSGENRLQKAAAPARPKNGAAKPAPTKLDSA